MTFLNNSILYYLNGKIGWRNLMKNFSMLTRTPTTNKKLRKRETVRWFYRLIANVYEMRRHLQTDIQRLTFYTDRLSCPVDSCFITSVKKCSFKSIWKHIIWSFKLAMMKTIGNLIKEKWNSGNLMISESRCSILGFPLNFPDIAWIASDA